MPMTDSALMPSSVTARKPIPASRVVSRSFQPMLACRIEPVSPVWKANHPMTTVARNPDGTR